ncbi:TetR family transcriptional regulator [Actinophytocola sp. KF-1]
MTFQRARSAEQREIRRRAILDTAAAMVAEMPVGEVTLNELSRRVGLAKSNVLRYFESREAVLLELLDDFLRTWLAELADELADVDPRRPAAERAERLADTLSRSLADRRALCELFGAQGGVLEHNVSLDVVMHHKRATLDSLRNMVELVHRYLPELGDNTRTVCLLTMIMAGALSGYCPPPAGVLAAYEADPALAELPTDLHESLRLAVITSIVGALPRS